jgi:two-component system sensor histidine kinase AlgZ
MHPILGQRGWRAAYAALWVALGAALALALVTRGVDWSWALAVTVPLAVLYGFLCLSVHYICQALPMRVGQGAKVVGSHVAAASVSALVWANLGAGWSHALSRFGAGHAVTDAFVRFTPALLVVGVLAFLLSSAVHYGIAAFEATREAERRALRLELLSREAELRALRDQVHPHFLFNSLNSINALIGSDPEGARRLCVLLADFLRGSLSMGSKKRISLDEEVRMAERLLAIEKARFGDRLTADVQVAEVARAFPVPPLILVPLVENAVTHGIANLLDGGAVTLRAQLRDGGLEVLLENPRDPDAPRRKGTGLGLENVRRRLEAAYGREARLKTEATKDSFRVEMFVPRPDAAEGR